MMEITRESAESFLPEEKIMLASVTVHAIEAILDTLRKYGRVYVAMMPPTTFVSRGEFDSRGKVPTLAEVLYGDRAS